MKNQYSASSGHSHFETKALCYIVIVCRYLLAQSSGWMLNGLECYISSQCTSSYSMPLTVHWNITKFITEVTVNVHCYMWEVE